jgi:hypothetical protein
MKSVDEQLAILKRGVAEIITEEELRRKLERSLKTNTPSQVSQQEGLPSDIPTAEVPSERDATERR